MPTAQTTPQPTPQPTYMLDTNIASAIIRGPSPAVAGRLRAVPLARVCISAITQGELLYGLARKPGATALQRVVQEFLLRVAVRPWDEAAAQCYGPLRASLEAQGTPLGSLDTQIAAHALALGCVLVSHDQAFGRVPGLKWEDWLQ